MPYNGFTPTRVGNTSSANNCCNNSNGSPPHAWGIRPFGTLRDDAFAAHPHTRGEYAFILGDD